MAMSRGNIKDHNGADKKRIVVIGGGTGTYTVLSGLKKYPDVWPSAIVSMADDGGSTGALRTALGVLPPGDIRRALVALSEAEEDLLKLFAYRFPTDALSGHNFGNLFLAALEKIHGGFDRAVEEASRILRVRGSVIPVTLDNVRLHARYEDGSEAHGETNIDIPKHDARLRVDTVWLDPAGAINPKARDAIQDAHAVVIGPGDLYTSVVPNLLVEGMREALEETKARKIYVVNIMTKRGETHGFCAEDFVRVVVQHLGQGVLTHVLHNTTPSNPDHIILYESEGADQVMRNGHGGQDGVPMWVSQDLLAQGPLVRHDADKLARAILSILVMNGA